MIPPSRPLALAACLLMAAGALPLDAQSATARATRAPADSLTTREIAAHIRFLSSDLLAGRAPATPGGALATEYIATELVAAGVQPGLDSSYFQTVPIDVVTTNQSSVHVTVGGKASGTLNATDDVVVFPGAATERSGADADVVFVGYGAAAPEYRWDDFKGVDVKGKILLVLVNDPPATRSEPDLFGGRAMTYYGRWTYKFEEAERRGAAGMLIIHTTEAAGYPWHTVVGSWTTPQRMLPRDPSLPAPLGFRGWITDSAATALLRQAGLDLAALRTQAATRDFRPVPTGITLHVEFANRVEHLASRNVVGVVRGTDPRLRNEYVVFSAHWDHLGVGQPVNGDSIYNGAYDNASGVATLLAIARRAADAPPRGRSMYFVFVTAEESGLLGSDWFATHLPVPARNVVADLNMDEVTPWGRVRDLRVLGADKSSLGDIFTRAIQPMGMRITPDEHPERGYFYRSDHFSFAKAGIPSVSINAGTDVVGKPAGWGLQKEEDFTAHDYHQPSDEMQPDWDLRGAVQIGEIVLDVGRRIAAASSVPTWNDDAEFKAARERQRAEQ
ncbi:MAG TPA: M28 family peptidase [Gemmatimonadaceae bacterium]|nr:M28 family peptidase [Gemmatimonadaceae bacterium]